MSPDPTDTPTLIELIANGQESAITLSAAAKLPELARDGKPLGLGAMYRLIDRGTSGVVLESCTHAGRICTTKPAVIRFLIRVDDARHRPRSVATDTPRRAAAAARQLHAKATKRLAAAGLV